MVDIPQHHAKIARDAAEAMLRIHHLRVAFGEEGAGGNKLEMSREFAGTETWLIEALPAHGAAVEDVEMLASVSSEPAFAVISKCASMT